MRPVMQRQDDAVACAVDDVPREERIDHDGCIVEAQVGERVLNGDHFFIADLDFVGIHFDFELNIVRVGVRVVPLPIRVRDLRLLKHLDGIIRVDRVVAEHIAGGRVPHLDLEPVSLQRLFLHPVERFGVLDLQRVQDIVVIEVGGSVHREVSFIQLERERAIGPR